MPKTWQPHPPEAGTTSSHNIPMALHKMGNGYP